jgi:hypothetical protein
LFFFVWGEGRTTYSTKSDQAVFRPRKTRIYPPKRMSRLSTG